MRKYADAQIAAMALKTGQNIQRESLRLFRAVVTAVSGGLVTIQRGGDDTASSVPYPVVVPGLPAIGAEIVAGELGGAPVIFGTLGRGGSPTVAPATAAGSTATTAGQTAGNDRNGVIELIPGGTGIAAGVQLTVTFAVPRPDEWYAIQLTWLTTAARTAGTAVGPTSRSANGFSLTSDIALSNGSVYRWSYAVDAY